MSDSANRMHVERDTRGPARTVAGHRVSEVHPADVRDPEPEVPSKLIPRHDPVSGTNAVRGFRTALTSRSRMMRYTSRVLLLGVLVTPAAVIAGWVFGG